jgi:hypothetical protein
MQTAKSHDQGCADAAPRDAFDMDILISPLSANSFDQATARSRFRRSHTYLEAAALAFPLARTEAERAGQLIERHEELVRAALRGPEDIAVREAHYDMMMACLGQLPRDTAVQVVLDHVRELQQMSTPLARPQAEGVAKEARAHLQRQRENGGVIDGAHLTDVMARFGNAGGRQLHGPARVRQEILRAVSQVLEDGLASDVAESLRWIWRNIAFYAPASVEGVDALIRLMDAEGVDVVAEAGLQCCASPPSNADAWIQGVRMNAIARQMQSVIARASVSLSVSDPSEMGSRRRKLDL